MSPRSGSTVPVPQTIKQLDTLAMQIDNLERVLDHGERRLSNLESRMADTPNIALRADLQDGLHAERRRLDAARNTIPMWREAWEIGDLNLRRSDSESSQSRRSSAESSRSSFSSSDELEQTRGPKWRRLRKNVD